MHLINFLLPSHPKHFFKVILGPYLVSFYLTTKLTFKNQVVLPYYSFYTNRLHHAIARSFPISGVIVYVLTPKTGSAVVCIAIPSIFHATVFAHKVLYPLFEYL